MYRQEQLVQMTRLDLVMIPYTAVRSQSGHLKESTWTLQTYLWARTLSCLRHYVAGSADLS